MYLKTQFTIFTQTNYFHSCEVRLPYKQQFIGEIEKSNMYKTDIACSIKPYNFLVSFFPFSFEKEKKLTKESKKKDRGRI